ncbi:sulfurtransferase [Xinfangfangia sp. D13-10-4-6]|uniref:sulfurtransferase n=1 Tax=Pseudogemmobacter hezensis TaxID=2737662 RepID=UPI00155580E6|nr:sulfurtransferase [Pseudogemmobacter hezensis]NPD14854.1 sulfurtransferase [Pseudogemmobacter hezensis]
MASIPPLVDGDWLEARLGDPQLRIFDATTLLAFPEDGQDGYYTLSSGRDAYVEEHISGAAFADLLLELTDQQAKHAFTVLPSQDFAERIGALGVGDDSIVVVYDQFDPTRNPDAFYQHWAGRLWWQLRLEGFGNVAVLDGGLAQWRREGRPVDSGETHYPPAQFTARRRPELIADKDQVRDAITREDVVLLNTVDPVTHAGGRSTFARPGHIPNSRNVWYEDLFDTATGKLKSPDDLRAHFSRVGALDPAKRTITYCGSGIAASVEALALATLGRDDVAVYDGSLTEWTADPDLPLETGADH